MNREQRRKMMNKGENIDSALKYLDNPCSMKEVVQISRGVAEDVVTDYQKRTSPVQVAISIQVEILKSLVISKGLITEEEFREQYIAKAEEFRKLQEEYENNSESAESDEGDSPKMDAKVGDIDIKVN